MYNKFDFGKQVKNVTAAFRRGLNSIPQRLRAIPRGYVAAANWAYDVGRFNPYMPFSHTSTQPHLYDELHIPFVKDLPHLDRVGVDPANMTVSIPFEMKGQRISALKTSKVDACGRSDFPRLLVTFRDVHPEFLGDETLLIQPGGSAARLLRQDDPNLTWMVWQPRNIKIVNKRREVTKTQAEIDAFDIARELSRYAKEGSNGAISVNPNQLLTAINIFTHYSDPLKARWKILADRYAFMRHLTARPYAVAAVLRSIIQVPPRELTQLISDMETGAIQTWSGFLESINAMPNVTAVAGGAAIAEQHGMRTSVYKDDQTLAENIPPSIFVSALGLPYFLAYLDAREKRVEPNLRMLAEENAQVVESMLMFHRRVAQVKNEAIQAGTEQLESGKPALIKGAEQAVRELLDLHEEQFRGNLIMEMPQVPASVGGPQEASPGAGTPTALPPGGGQQKPLM